MARPRLDPCEKKSLRGYIYKNKKTLRLMGLNNMSEYTALITVWEKKYIEDRERQNSQQAAPEQEG